MNGNTIKYDLLKVIFKALFSVIISTSQRTLGEVLVNCLKSTSVQCHCQNKKLKMQYHYSSYD